MKPQNGRKKAVEQNDRGAEMERRMMKEYIEKQHILDFLDGCIEEEKGTRHQVIVEAIKLTVERMPSADVVERKRGKWVKNEGRVGWHCSNCGVDNNFAYSWNNDTGRDEFQDNFCPNCGADMRG